MFIEESLWIRSTVAALDLPPGAEALDIGSSTRDFRTVVQPHIERYVFAPLRDRGIRVTCLDAKAEDGVDIVCDVTDPAVQPESVVGRRFALVLCTNLLEHVTDRGRVVAVVSELVADGGYLLMTVPQVYRYHEDPIDTGYRPDTEALASLVQSANPDFQVTSAQTVMARDWRYYRPRTWRKLYLPDIPDLLRYLVPAWRWRQSCVLLRRETATPPS